MSFTEYPPGSGLYVTDPTLIEDPLDSGLFLTFRATVLNEQEYQLGEEDTSLVFGGVKTSPYYVQQVDWGLPAIRTNDAVNPLNDGTMFGRDFLAGPLATFDMNIITRGSALDTLAPLASAWLGDGARSDPNAVLPLRYKIDGRTRRVYGRPRNCVPTQGAAKRGWIPVTATFQRQDHLFYADVEESNTVTFYAISSGGITVPRVVPAYFVGVPPPRTTTVNITGDKPTWVCLDIRGPISNPVVQLVGGWTLTLLMDIGEDQMVTVDSRPWSRGIRDNYGGNYSGRLDWASPLLSELQLPTGSHDVVLHGNDPTGTSTLTTRWRAAHASY